MQYTPMLQRNSSTTNYTLNTFRSNSRLSDFTNKQEAISDPISVDELEETLLQEENSLRINSANSAVGVLELYEKRVEEIKTIEARIEGRQTEIDTVATQITAYREIWEPRLDLMVKRVSEAFS